MATLNFLRCTDNEFLAKHRTAVLLDDVAARRHRFAAGGDSNIVACSCNLSESGSDRAQRSATQTPRRGGGSRF